MNTNARGVKGLSRMPFHITLALEAESLFAVVAAPIVDLFNLFA